MAGDNRIGDNDFFQNRCVDPFDGRSRENAVCSGRIDFPATGILNGFCRIDKGSCGIYHIVYQQNVFAFYIADDVHDFCNVGFRTPLVHDYKIGAQRFGKCTGQLYAAHVRRCDDKIVQAHGADMFDQDNTRIQVIKWNIEKPLDLRSMQVHGQDAVCSGFCEQVGYELCGDCYTWSVLAVLACIAIVRDNRGNPGSRGSSGGIDHDEQFHQIVCRRIGRLDDEHVGAPDRLEIVDRDLSVGKVFHFCIAKRHVKVVSNFFSKRCVASPCKNFDWFCHGSLLFRVKRIILRPV